MVAHPGREYQKGLGTMGNHTSISGIYIILNTKNNKVYIGQTKDFRKRWQQHKRLLSRGCHDNAYLQAAWNKYGAAAFRFKKLEYCPVEELNQREQHYLQRYVRTTNCYNISLDAQAPTRGHKLSEETRRKISQALKNPSEEVRRNRREGAKDRKSPTPFTEEHRRKMSQAAKGKKHPPMSEETRRKVSESKKGTIITEEQRVKMSAALKGHLVSDETREKLRKASSNMSDDVKRRISQTKMGHATSEETRKKISESVKRYIAEVRAAEHVDE